MTSAVSSSAARIRPLRLPGVALAALLLLGSCGRRGELLGILGGNRDGGGADGPGAVADGSGVDTSVPEVPLADAPAGDAPGSTAPRFSMPRRIMAVSDPFAQDSDPTFTGDLLELIFTSDRNGSPDLWVSRRPSAADPWGPPVPVTELNGPAAEYGAAVSLDGLRLWFTTDRDGSAGRIWRSLRPSRNAPWGMAFPVAEFASSPGGPVRDFAPAMDATETMVMFSSNRLGSASYDVYFATRPGGGMPWGTPRLAPGINGPSEDLDPFVAQGGLVVFFASTRQGGGDLLWSARQSTAEDFPAALPLTDLNSSAYDSDPTLSQDLTYMIFDSNRSGTFALYEARLLVDGSN